MALEPLHPDEAALHHELRDALNQQLTSTDLFVWIRVEPTGDAHGFEHLDRIVLETERWLSSLDPDVVDAADLPGRAFSDKAAEIEVRAIPKKPEARGQRAAQIVGNPEPALAGWVP